MPPPGMGVINVAGVPQLVPLSAIPQFMPPATADHVDLQRQIAELQRQMQMQQMSQQAPPAANQEKSKKGEKKKNKSRDASKGKGKAGKGGRVKEGKGGRVQQAAGEPNSILSLLQLEMKPGGAGSGVLELKQIADHVVELSQDQFGSRFIQQKLEEASNADMEMVYKEASSETTALSKDVFGNYVIQKLLQHGNRNIVCGLTVQLVPKALELSLHNYGCRVIQRAIEMSDDEGRNDILQRLEGQEARLLQDSKGNHVIQKCIQMVRGGLTLAILELFKSNEACVNFAQHEYGCRVVQRILEHCSASEVEPVLSCVLSNVIPLSMNQFGNYVIQHLLQNGNKRIYDAIGQQIQGQVLNMSLHKFASNVIEKALMAPELSSCVVDECLEATTVDNVDEEEGDEEQPDSPLVLMMKDQYGNYVVQKMLEHSAPAHRGCLLKAVQEAAAQLKQGSYSIHILNLAERLIE